MFDISPWFIAVMASIYLLGCLWEWGAFGRSQNPGSDRRSDS